MPGGGDGLFGKSDQLIDILSLPERTISDPSLEAQIRAIIGW
jgi:hypothetical protein